MLFELKEELGRGAFGAVYRAIHNGSELAIKEILNITSQNDIQNEIEILKMCHHQNIVSYLGSVIKEDSLWILMDYMALGSIRDMIEARGMPYLTEPEIAYVCAYTIKGLNYLHSRCIIHRDVKAANILLNGRAEIKIADFGVSGFFSTPTTEEMVGTPLWMAPEILKRKPATPSCDIWSIGITAIEMGDGHPPNHNLSVIEAMQLTVNTAIPSPTFVDPQKWSANLIDFLSTCLQKDHMKRSSAYKLLSHPFLNLVFEDEKLQPIMLKTAVNMRVLKGGSTDTIK